MDEKNRFICYLDILGFTRRISDNHFAAWYKYLISEIIEPYNYHPDKVYLLSDSVVIIGEDFHGVVQNSFSIYSRAFDCGVFIRGGLTKGQVEIPQDIQESGNKVIIPYLGEAFIKAYELEQSINSAAICVDDKICDEIADNNVLLIKCNEIFPKGKDYEKIFLVADMNNPSVPASILAKISEEIPNLSKHDIPKFINTFCLYFKVLKDVETKFNMTPNYKKASDAWKKILESLIKKMQM